MSTSPVDSRQSGENERRILKRQRDPFLYRPIELRSVTARNRIMLSPMCQYSAVEGMPNDWHFVHLGARAAGGAGIVFTEAVHTEPRGRITPHCLGLWSDAQGDAFRRIADFIGAAGAVPGIQLGHAGRKASVGRPWEGTNPIAVGDGGWPVVSASPRAYARGWPEPHPLTEAEISQIAGEVGTMRLVVRRVADGYTTTGSGNLIDGDLVRAIQWRVDGLRRPNPAPTLLDELRAMADRWDREIQFPGPIGDARMIALGRCASDLRALIAKHSGGGK